MIASDPALPVGTPLLAPPLRRRLACFVYEAVLLFGVIFFAALVYSVLTHQRNALVGREGLMLVALVISPGLYFGWYWSQTGQTLPMQTWRIRVLTADGQRLSRGQALRRYAASWIWVLPPLLLVWLAGWHGSRPLALTAVGWIVGYAASSRLHPERQFWHDAFCGTRLVDTRTP